ncbi:hypothetical protein N7447_002545 [Penicillium robsamsonii]|uniref:uncharacterized protein n=1 Tax=Penicillium robsamsonii TaxID=1792511 RepID=UPI002548448E|nr:uncharacterized protein N7447_002545 [Penicillium robsamsonii]KAJ5836519.1 hypothetical protein N7447_002545 [Penicillium robsamsonii]
MSPSSPFADTYDPIRDLLQGFDLCRGLREVIGLSWHWVKEGRISDVLLRVDDNKRWPLSDVIQEAFSNLKRLNENRGKEISTHDTGCYASAIDYLTDLMEIYQDKPRRVELALRWPFQLTDKHQWWMEGWSLHLARSIWNLLDEYWRPSAIWVLRKVGLEV